MTIDISMNGNAKMHILLTGACGMVGSHVLTYLLRHGHAVTSVDIVPLPPTLAAELTPSQVEKHHIVDLASITATDALFESAGPFDGVIHFGAIPNPAGGKDWRFVHNNNVASSYNVLYTAGIKYGIKRITQASSVNATGLSYTREGMQEFDEFPMTEKETYRAEDAYALSKQFCEMQAVSLCRLDSSLRIASLRLHHCRETYEDAIPHILPGDLWSWTSFESCAESALLGLTSEGWTGAEVFIICSDETGWEGGVTYESIRKGSKPERETSVLDLIKHAYPQVKIREEYWKENKRRSVFDNSKAKKMLGWEHRDIGKA